MSHRDEARFGWPARRAKLLGIGAAVSLLAFPLWGVALADNDNRGREAGADRALRLLTLVPVPVGALNNTAGGMYSFDISNVDQSTQTYYLADRSNKVVDVVDASTGQFITQIQGGFKGFTPCTPPAGANDCAGPNGVVGAFPFLFVTDGGSRVVSFDLRNNPPSIISDVTTRMGDPRRADELAYDPDHGLLLVINNADSPPFGTLIKVDKHTGKLTVGTQIPFDAAHLPGGATATNGAEQPVWDPGTGKFYLSIPEINGDGHSNIHGAVARISITGTVEALYPIDHCGPAGLALGPKEDLFVGCNTVFDTQGNVWDPNGAFPAVPHDVIIDAKTGQIDANVIGVGAGDEVTFNPGDGNYYATGSGSPERPLPATAKGSTPAGVVDARDQALLQLFPTYNVPAVTVGGLQTGPTAHPAGTSHSIAANSHNNLVFVPLPANNAIISPDGMQNCLTGCIAIFGHPDEDSRH
jgi:hypothetical protein